MPAGKPVFRRPVRLPLVVAAALALGVLLLMPLGVQTRTREALADMVHAPAFGALAVLVAAWILGRRAMPGPAEDLTRAPAESSAGVSPGTTQVTSWSPERICLAVWIGVTLVGGLTEMLQAWVGRGRSLHDGLSNSLGAAAFLSAYLALRAQDRRRRLRWGAVAAGGLAAAWLLPLLVLADVWRQPREVPRLAGFERSGEFGRWTLHHASMARVAERATEGKWAALVEFEAGHFSAIVLRMAELDWRGHTALEFDLYLARELPAPLYLEVVDRVYNGKVDDRYDEPLALRPGANHVRIPLAEIVAGPRGRPLDLSRIWWLELYLVDSPRTSRVFLDNLRLTGAAPSAPAIRTLSPRETAG